MKKLTKAQRSLLEDVSLGNDKVSDSYQPAKSLVTLGLCTWEHGKFGSSLLKITDAGRAALKEASDV